MLKMLIQVCAGFEKNTAFWLGYAKSLILVVKSTPGAYEMDIVSDHYSGPHFNNIHGSFLDTSIFSFDIN